MPFSARLCLTPDAYRKIAAWAVLSFLLNLAWEMAQLPLYVIPRVTNMPDLAYAVLHCTAGDVLIAVGGFVLALFALEDPGWPSTRPWPGLAIATLYGLGYTAYSEWYNVYQAGNWRYSPDMPLLFGLGVAPLLQWTLLPGLTALISRRTMAHAVRDAS